MWYGRVDLPALLDTGLTAMKPRRRKDGVLVPPKSLMAQQALLV